MNSSFFRTTLITFFISIIFIFLCFSSLITTLSNQGNVLVNNSSIAIPESFSFSFSGSQFLWPTPRL